MRDLRGIGNMVEEENEYQLSCVVASIPTSVNIFGLDLTTKYKLDSKQCADRFRNTIVPKLARFLK